MNAIYLARRAAVVVALALTVPVHGEAVFADEESWSLRFTPHTLGQSRGESCDVADFNRDGKLDIVAGEFLYLAPDWQARRIRELKGEVDDSGKGYLWDFSNLPLDVDGDGRLDIVSFFWDRDSYWFRNAGDQEGLWESHSIEQLSAFESAELCDLDADGKQQEIIIHGRATVWYELARGDDGRATLVMHVVSTENTGIGAGVGDINGDGRPDIVKPGAWYEAPADPRKGTWIEHPNLLLQILNDRPEHTPQILIHDFSGDGLPDLLTSSAHNRGIYWYEQTREDSGEIYLSRHLIDDSWTQAHSLALADLDRDGDLDFLAGKRYMAHNGKDPGAEEPLGVYWYERVSGDEVAWKRHAISHDEGIGSGLNISVADLDADGDLDFVVTGKWGGPVWFENQLLPDGDARVFSAPAASMPNKNDARTKLVLIAGPCEHSAGSHEAEAAVRLLKHCLDRATMVGPIETLVCYGWPEDESILADAATLVFTGDGFPPSRAPQPAKAMAQFERLMAKGCGIVCLHYAMGLKKEQATKENAQRLLKWLGGYFAPGKSKGGFYEKIDYIPHQGDHPILRGWKSFSFRGESYWGIEFLNGAFADKIVPIATTMMPPDKPQRHVVVWALQRGDGGRAVGIVPPHYYRNWRIDDLRTMILNSIVWSAKMSVPAEGVQCEIRDLSVFEPQSVEPTWLPPKWRESAK